jgi:hypothetical protein
VGEAEDCKLVKSSAHCARDLECRKDTQQARTIAGPASLKVMLQSSESHLSTSSSALDATCLCRWHSSLCFAEGMIGMRNNHYHNFPSFSRREDKIRQTIPRHAALRRLSDSRADNSQRAFHWRRFWASDGWSYIRQESERTSALLSGLWKIHCEDGSLVIALLA